MGNAEFINNGEADSSAGTYVSIDQEVLGCFNYKTDLREGLSALLKKLADKFKLTLLSGDGDHQKQYLSKQFPWLNSLHFSKSPMDKLQFVENLQHQGNKVMMLGDGLNDSGALKKSGCGYSSN